MKKAMLVIYMFFAFAVLPGCAQISHSGDPKMASHSKADLRLLVVFDAGHEFLVLNGRLLTEQELQSMLKHNDFSPMDEITLQWPKARLTAEETERIGVFWKRVIDLFAANGRPLGIAFQIRDVK